MSLWISSVDGGLVVDADGNLLDCETCPCDDIPAGPDVALPCCTRTLPGRFYLDIAISLAYYTDDGLGNPDSVQLVETGPYAASVHLDYNAIGDYWEASWTCDGGTLKFRLNDIYVCEVTPVDRCCMQWELFSDDVLVGFGVFPDTCDPIYFDSFGAFNAPDGVSVCGQIGTWATLPNVEVSFDTFVLSE